MFEMRERACLGRVGRLRTSHGVVETPALMPVVNPSNLLISPEELRRRFRIEILMTNAYIIYRSRFRDQVLERGIHHILDFEGPIMSDSGAFQQHVYGRVDVSNEEIVKFQTAMGSDLGAVLDIFSEPDSRWRECEEGVRETLSRCEEAVAWKGEMGLVGTVQGGLFSDLRTKCARSLSQIDLRVQAIGGVVPLMEGYRFADLVEVIIASKRGLRPDRPVHLFGAGHPITFGLAVLLGCDLFDSAAYAKYAYDGRMITRWGTTRVKNLRYVSCSCPACFDATPKDLKDDVKRLAEHNLHVSLQELEELKQAIHEGSLWEHVERRSRAHPRLLEALKTLRKHVDFLERYEKLSDGSLFYAGPESMWRPVAWRFRRRVLERYRPPEAESLLILQEARRPYSRTYASLLRDLSLKANAHAVVRSVLGPVPIELDEVYPVAQSVIPRELDVEALEASEVFLRQFLRLGHFSFGVLWEGDKTIAELASKAKGPSSLDMDMARARAVADYQFGSGASDALLGGEVELVKSKKKGKIRNVYVDSEHVLSLRAGDGLYTLKMAGGRRLHATFGPPRLRVVVNEESAPFNREGRNAFAKFVVECDDSIRPWEEVLVVDESDDLLAVGRAIMNREEMMAFQQGVAVKVREGSALS
ncbi:MAG: tRNA guanosine(15) transglycosylase TgtA [Candidatus Thermoplasmatota archaeon]|nr:tRNA guanosine(15) transglycosylase TgtA [Candidatus Thermoplasmatota archaeon]